MGIKRSFPTSGKGRNIYATIYLDNHRLVDPYRCNLYVNIVADYADYIECEAVDPQDPDATFYISKDVIAMIRVEDKF